MRLNPLSTGKSVQTVDTGTESINSLNPLSTGKSVQTMLKSTVDKIGVS